FSKDIILQLIAWFTYSNSDFLVAGRVLGEQALGGYTMAWTLANTPIDKSGSVILQVTPSVLSAVQHDQAATARYVASTTETIAGVTFPLFIGLALVAPDFVTVVLGAKWAFIITPLRLLSVYACFRVILPVLAQVLTIRGEERFAAHNMMLGAVVLPITFLIASRWGLTGIATGWILVHPLIAFRLVDRALKSLGMTFRQFFAKPLWPAVSSCAVMAVGVLGVNALVPSGTPHWQQLLAATAAGAVGYCGSMIILHRDRLRVLFSMFATLKSA
ncbi:MAG: oligosaccharide flippase family protein, partial [Gemmatimonadaceae bacterium]